MGDAQLKLVVIDPSLRGTHGHHLVFAEQIWHEAEKRGLSFSAVCHREFPRRVSDMPCARHFHDNIYFGFDSGWSRLQAIPRVNLNFERKLKAISAAVFDRQTIAYFPTVNEYLFPAICNWLKSYPQDRRPYCCVNLMFPCGLRGPSDSGGALHDATAAATYLAAFESLGEADRDISLFGYGQEIRSDYENLLGRGVTLHPLIFSPEIGEYLARKRAPSTLKEAASPARVLVHAGHVRKDKQPELLPELVHTLVAMPGLKVLAHAHLAHRNAFLAGIIRSLDEIAAQCDSFDFFSGRIGDREYLDLLVSSDIVLFTHRPRDFLYKTSGVLYEAAYLEKILVVPENTCLERECRAMGCSFFPYGTDFEEIIAAIGRAVQASQMSLPKTQMQDFRYKWGPEAVVGELVDGWSRRSLSEGPIEPALKTSHQSLGERFRRTISRYRRRN